MYAPRRSTPLALAVATITLLLACAPPAAPGQSGSSQLELKLGAPPPDAAPSAACIRPDRQDPAVDQIVVNVSEVTAHSTSSGWITVGPIVSPTAVNVLDLESSLMSLGLASLPAGKITQIRLIIEPTGNYVVRTGATAHEPLVVPSGTRTGIKILGPWDVPECTRLSVTLDFDGKHSIEYHDVGGIWILRPVIRPRHAVTTAITCEVETEPPPECSAEIPCPEGQLCDAGACVTPIRLPVGGSCTDPLECISGNCSGGTCAPGLADAPCRTYLDCVSSACIEGACAP